MVMDKCTEFYPVEGEIFPAERVVVPGGANEEFSVGGREGSFNNGKKAK